MSLVTTHVLDTSNGKPAAGIAVRFERQTGGWQPVAEGVTDADGRIRDLGPETLENGVYRLIFDTAEYLGPEAFFPDVTIAFRITDGTSHHHVPVLLSPFAYSTYRGS